MTRAEIICNTANSGNETDDLEQFKTRKNSESINDKYGIQVLPTKILIDKNMLILGRYEGTEQGIALDNKLKEIFNR